MDEAIKANLVLKHTRALDQLEADFNCCHDALFNQEVPLSYEGVKVRVAVLQPMLNDYKFHLSAFSEILENEQWQAVQQRYETFRNRYYSIQTDIAVFRSKIEAAKTPVQNTSTLDASMTSGSRHSALKTPKIDTPQFDGTPENWLKFRDLFEAMIHNSEVDNIVKFQYLEIALSKVPRNENPLNNFSVKSDRYEDAWAAVCQRYDDKRKIIAIHLEALFAVKPMKAESAKEIRRIVDSFSANLSALKQCGFALAESEDLANLVIVHMVTSKLEAETLKDWRKFHDEDTATWKELHDFLVAQFRSLEEICAPKVVQQKPKVDQKPSDKSKSSSTFVAEASPTKTSTPSSPSSCSLCGNLHSVWNCTLSPQEKYKSAREKGFCLNCLSKGHKHSECSSKSRCKHCGKAHHSLLHFPRDDDQAHSSKQSTDAKLSPSAATFKPYSMVKTAKTNAVTQDWNSVNTAVTLTSSSANYSRQAILSTISVGVMAADGTMYLCRALLDSGSDSNFMSTALAHHLQLELHPICVPLVGINQKTTIIRFKASTTIASHYGPYQKDLQFNVMQRLTGNIPSGSIDGRHFRDIPKDCQLADPQFNIMGDVDLLLNADIFFDSLLPEKIVLESGAILLHSTFGWIAGGSVPLVTTTLLSSISNHAHTNFEDLDTKLDNFFRAEDVEQATKVLTPEEKFCIQLFDETTSKDENGQFVVVMPCRDNYEKLGSNLKTATRQAYMQETRRAKDPVYNQLYCEYMHAYIQSNHMSEIDQVNDPSRHYLPHHGVVKMSSLTTKVRAVFNASCKSETGLSLNDVLCVGPTVQPESFDILLRFREKRYSLTGDIERMYLAVLIHPSQRKLLSLVWREDPQTPFKHYNMNCVTFGTACAPFLATNCVKTLAVENRDKYPKASAIIESSFYVDDLLCGFDDLLEGLTLRDQIRDILKSAGMLLRKISSNFESMYFELPEEDKLPNNTENSITKTLGIAYSATSDQFSYTLKPVKTGVITKASVLSEIASIFDPIGWLGPVILKAKLFMKLLWQHKLSWTDELSEDLQEQWNSFRKDFYELNNIRINRHCYILNHVSVEIHGFCDASNDGYGAVIYALSYDSLGNHQVSLLCSKSRVSPTRQISLPRLELCGATLLAKLNSRILKILDVSVNFVTLWSDSSIVLCWITMTSSTLKTYVGNRVSQIQEHSHQHTWKHIEGSQNPADIISRGLDPADLQACELWWSGPRFFALPKSQWPTSIITINESDPQIVEEVKKSTFAAKISINDLFTFIETRFSKLSRLINVLVYVLRFLNNAKTGNRQSGTPTIDEQHEALMTAVKIVQRVFFPQEYSLLSKFAHQTADEVNKTPIVVSKNSSIVSLLPFMDKEGILRVSGRVSASAELNYNQKHQIILPPCHLALLIVRDLHKKNLHPGSSAMKSFIRQQFWIIQSRKVISKAARECLTCFRANPSETQQLMASLPAARVNMSPPFQNTALDYAGFYWIKTGTTRNAPKTKAYVALFKCMCTGAVHLELASDLSTNAFISALDRFMSRRGIIEEIFCDNATAFHGADNDLKKIVDSMAPEIKQYCTEKQTRFRFTTPRASHAGGIYESGIKSMKHHLKRVLDERSLTFEQFTTLLCKIEAILNSRPLTPLSEDPRDMEVLTPGHFLIFRPLNARPERNFVDRNGNHLDRWNIVQQLQQQFWKLWYNDYLHHLQTRPINFRQKFEFAIGDLVLVKDSNLPPMKWLIGRIIDTFPGKDGIIRNVRVLTKLGEKDRHVKYLCFLPPTQSTFEAPESVRRSED